MKEGYLGGMRGYQSAFYRPGQGWSEYDHHRRFGLQPVAVKTGRHVRVAPLTVAYRRRPGLGTRTLIVSSVLVVGALLALVLSGGAPF
jgi:hypothetical protein